MRGVLVDFDIYRISSLLRNLTNHKPGTSQKASQIQLIPLLGKCYNDRTHYISSQSGGQFASKCATLTYIFMWIGTLHRSVAGCCSNLLLDINAWLGMNTLLNDNCPGAPHFYLVNYVCLYQQNPYLLHSGYALWFTVTPEYTFVG